MEAKGTISAAEMAERIRFRLNVTMDPDIATGDGAAFEITAAATGERFTVTIGKAE